MPNREPPTVKLDPAAVQAIQDDLGISTNEIARQLPKDVSQVSRWLRGIHEPERRNAQKLAEILKCTIKQLTGEEPYTKKRSSIDISPPEGAKDKERLILTITRTETKIEFPPGTPIDQVLKHVAYEYHVELKREGLMQDGVLNPAAQIGSLIITGEYTKEDIARFVSAFLSGRLAHLNIKVITIAERVPITVHIQDSAAHQSNESTKDNSIDIGRIRKLIKLWYPEIIRRELSGYLDDQEFQILDMLFVGDLSVEHVANALGIDTNGVYTARQHAWKCMREILSRPGNLFTAAMFLNKKPSPKPESAKNEMPASLSPPT